jgi:hypothetical protein
MGADALQRDCNNLDLGSQPFAAAVRQTRLRERRNHMATELRIEDTAGLTAKQQLLIGGECVSAASGNRRRESI